MYVFILILYLILESSAKILWNGKWTTFLDNIMLLCSILEADDSTKLKLLFSIQRITIDFENLNFELEKGIFLYPKKGILNIVNSFYFCINIFFSEITVSFEKDSGLISCNGLEIICPQLKNAIVPKRLSKELVCNTLKFIPYLSRDTAVSN